MSTLMHDCLDAPSRSGNLLTNNARRCQRFVEEGLICKNGESCKTIGILKLRYPAHLVTFVTSRTLAPRCCLPCELRRKLAADPASSPAATAFISLHLRRAVIARAVTGIPGRTDDSGVSTPRNPAIISGANPYSDESPAPPFLRLARPHSFPHLVVWLPRRPPQAAFLLLVSGVPIKPSSVSHGLNPHLTRIDPLAQPRSAPFLRHHHTSARVLSFPDGAIPHACSPSSMARSSNFPLHIYPPVEAVENEDPQQTLHLGRGSVSPKSSVLFKIDRGGKDFVITVTPDQNSDGSGRIGVQLAPNVKILKEKPKDVLEAFSLTGREFWGLTSNVEDSLKQAVLNFSQSASKVSGPIAIIAVGAEVAKSNVDGLYQFLSVLAEGRVGKLFNAAFNAKRQALLKVGALRTFQYEITKTYIQRLSSWMKASTEEVSRNESWVPVSVLGSRFFWQIWDQFCTALASTVCEVFGFNRQQLDDKIFKGQFRHSASFGNCKKKQDLRALTDSFLVCCYFAAGVFHRRWGHPRRRKIMSSKALGVIDKNALEFLLAPGNIFHVKKWIEIPFTVGQCTLGIIF
ncbi:hypothetical protein LXL04_013960 [Taraxacum kok-saghyz]